MATQQDAAGLQAGFCSAISHTDDVNPHLYLPSWEWSRKGNACRARSRRTSASVKSEVKQPVTLRPSGITCTCPKQKLCKRDCAEQRCSGGRTQVESNRIRQKMGQKHDYQGMDYSSQSRHLAAATLGEGGVPQHVGAVIQRGAVAADQMPVLRRHLCMRCSATR